MTQVVQLTWSFSVEVTDEMKLRLINLDAVKDLDGEVDGFMDFTLDQKVARRLHELVIVTNFWDTAEATLGVKYQGGMGLHPRPRNDDGSYPAYPLPAMNADGGLVINEDE